MPFAASIKSGIRQPKVNKLKSMPGKMRLPSHRSQKRRDFKTEGGI
jgi:hypothetical protein